MKPVLTLCAIALLGCGVAACGGAGADTHSAASSATVAATSSADATTSSSTPAGGYLKNDGDEDGDDGLHRIGPPEDDDEAFLNFYGKKAGPTDKQAVTTLVKRYYTAAAAGNGAAACALLSSTLSTGLTEGQSPQGTKTCAAVVSPLLTEQHQRFVADNVPTMVVIGVRAKGDLGLAVLGFKATPISTILLMREKGAWKINALFDSVIR